MNEIRLDIKIVNLLNNYEWMKDMLIRINPKLNKLEIRRTQPSRSSDK